MRPILLLAALLALFSAPVRSEEADHFVLALSWSPAYCGTRTGRQDMEQCAPGANHGFVVHGLWPQGGRGQPPAHCAAPSPVPAREVEAMLPIMPSRTLVEHQWAKHGTCSGSGSEQYFAATRAAFAKVKVPVFLERPSRALTLAPAEVERMFLAANPGLPADGFALVCRGRYASEVRICLDRALNFRACAAAARDRCRDEAVFLPTR